MDRELVERYVRIGMAALAAFLHSIPELTYFLLWLMLLDTFFGMAVAIKRQRLSAREALVAANQKMGVLGILVLAAMVNRYVNFLGLDLVTIATVFYIGPQILSILKNAAIIGIPIPPQIVGVLRVFQDREIDNAPGDSKDPDRTPR